jgi:hypothetical protein
MIVPSELNPRQAKLSAFYKARNVPLFGASEYTLLVPAPDSILLTDENVTLAFILFGDHFDRKLRSVVVAIWLPALIFQLACSPIGFLTLTGIIPTEVVILTFPGAIFPFLLLLRSHFIVLQALSMKWEPLFLTFYSILWCLSITCVVGIYDLRNIFVWLVIFPSLMASTFADASAVRLDFAFLKGDLSITALTMPPYLISLAYVFSFIGVLNTRTHIEVENQQKSLLVESSGLSFDIKYSYLATITGFTISIFIVRSIIMLFYNSSRCISLSAAISFDVVKFSKISTTRETRNKKKRKDSAKEKFGKSKRIGSDKKLINDEKKDGDNDVFILEAGFLLKGGTGLVPTHGQLKSNAVFRMISRQISSQNLDSEEIIIPPAPLKKFSMEDIRIVPQLSTKKISNITTSITPFAGTEVPVENQSHVVLHQLVGNKRPSFTLDNSSTNDAAVIDIKQSLSRNEVELTTRNSEVSRFAKISGQLSQLRPPKIRPFGHIENQCVNNLVINNNNGDVNASIDYYKDHIDDKQSQNDHKKNDMEQDNSCNSDCNGDNSRKFFLKNNFSVGDRDKGEKSVIVDNISNSRNNCNHDDAKIQNGTTIENNDISVQHIINNNIKDGCNQDNESETKDNVSKSQNKCNNNEIANNTTHAIKHDTNSVDNKCDKLNNDAIVDENTHLSDRQRRLYPFYKSVNAEIFGPHDYTLLSPMASCILVSDECITVGSVLFGDTFDHNLRTLVRYIWYPAYIFQIGCLPIGVISLLGYIPGWGALFMIPGFIFPMLILLQCHWKIFQALLYSWEPIFITFYSTIFCISITLMIYDYRTVYIWVVVFPTLISSAFSDASAVRLDHAFLNKTQQKFLLRNVILYASPTYIASLLYIFSILVLLNIQVKLPFRTTGYLDIQSALLDTKANFSIAATTTGATIIIFMLKCLFKLIKEPTQCVSLRAPMTIEMAYLEPPPLNASECESGTISSHDHSKGPQKPC